MRQTIPRALHDMLPPCCYNCGSTDGLEWHHIVPLSKGGKNIVSNLVPLCSKCHSLVHGRGDNPDGPVLSELIKDGIQKRREQGLPIGRNGYDKEPVMELIAQHFSLFAGGTWTENEIMEKAGIKRTLFHECVNELCEDMNSGEWNHDFQKPVQIREKPLHAKTIMAMRKRDAYEDQM